MTDLYDELDDTVLNLGDYLNTVEMVVKETFSHHVWIRAEIRNLSSKNGHYYFELAEKDDKGKIIASCRGNLWKYQADRVLKKFLRFTGMQLTRDLTVMLKVTATMHPQYGFALSIIDIDPNYTIGDLARQYTAMLDRLSAEGLTHLNKSKSLPLDLRHIIVISPEKAAGLGDFRVEADRLSEYGVCNFHYYHATFQGNHAPNEIRHAIINSISCFQKSYGYMPDIMVIIRGGGAVGDLAYLNDYELGALIAEQDIPVWIGVGHERDRVILDEVAHTSFDTPSKVIHAIIHHLRKLVENANEYIDILKKTSRQQIQDVDMSSQQLINNVYKYGVSCLNKSYKNTEKTIVFIHQKSQEQISRAQYKNYQLIQTLKNNAQHTVDQLKIETSYYIDNVNQLTDQNINRVQEQIFLHYNSCQSYAYQKLNYARKNTNHLREVILLQNPRNVLKKGYAIITNEKSQVLTSIQKVREQGSIQIELQDGKASISISQLLTHN